MEENTPCFGPRCKKPLTDEEAVTKLFKLKKDIDLDTNTNLKNKIDIDLKLLIPSNQDMLTVNDIPLLSKIIETHEQIYEGDFNSLDTTLGENFRQIAKLLKHRDFIDDKEIGWYDTNRAAAHVRYDRKIILRAAIDPNLYKFPGGGKSRRLKKRRKKTKRRR